MFSRFTRLPLRRCLHTLPSRPTQSFNRIGLTVGASAAAAATYLAWRLTSDSHSIALDSATKFPPVQQPSVSSPSEPILRPSSLEPKNPAIEPTLETGATPETADISDETAETSPTNADGESSPDDAGSGGAFNPVTGEINWDCPCLGGMAHGPCGPQFREAFSCFVFSEEEPKGINCVEKFKAMQDCFREHPDVYGDEIMDDDDDDEPAPAPTATEEAVVASSNPDSDETNPEPAPQATQPKSRKQPPFQTPA